MKFTDATSLFDGEPAHIALLSTYQFDPAFFERRLLRMPALSKARRIVVFMDSSQWHRLVRSDTSAKILNRRYLVVPVSRTSGVFHPKLSLILGEVSGQVICGSNNLTRSGCTSNLELLNRIPFDHADDAENALDIAKDAYHFFVEAAKHAPNQIGKIAQKWLAETADTYPYLRHKTKERDGNVTLLHSYQGPIWNRLSAYLAQVNPADFFVISPFHDKDGGFCKQLIKQHPKATIRFLVQQRYTGFPIASLCKYSNISLLELKNYSRRLHAKLVGWNDGSSVGCVTGSANFTTAGFSSGNVEACLLIKDAGQLIGELFDREMSHRPISFDEFEPGPNDEQDADQDDKYAVVIHSAVLSDQETITVSYKHHLGVKPDALWLTIRVPGESRPRYQTRLPSKPEATVAHQIANKTALDSSGTLLATIVAESGGQRFESSPYWIVQEGRLTYEPGESQASSENKIVETGEGLAEFIDDLGKREGVNAVIEYLRHLNIRYEDGIVGGGGLRPFKLKMHDPYRPDEAPKWLLEAHINTEDLAEAIYEFTDRHEHRRLLRHVARGNINGIGNYLDILTSLTRLLSIYHARNVITWQQVLKRLLKYVQLSTGGAASEEDTFGGYLLAVVENLGSDLDLIQKVCNETNFLAEVRAVLWLAQYLRFTGSKGREGLRVRDMLPSHVRSFNNFLQTHGFDKPTKESVRNSLHRYNMLPPYELGMMGN